MTGPAGVIIGSLDLEAIERLADSMIRYLPRPMAIGLVGTLGAGKTTLVQAIARAAGIDSADVTSPTFTLLQTHLGSLTIHHLDAYRIVDEDEFLELGVEELFDDANAWTIIEWADRVRGVMPLETLWVEIQIEADVRFRSITITTSDPGTASAVNRIAQQSLRGQ